MGVARRTAWAVICVLAALNLSARSHFQGYVQQGGQRHQNVGVFAITRAGSIQSNPYSQQSYPNATVTVCQLGLDCIADPTKIATIYSNATGTTLANPFIASNTGYFSFYGDFASCDLRFSGGGIATPFTWAGFTAGAIDLTTTYVSALATGGVGTLVSPWTGWEAAVNALPVGSDIYFPAGSYTQSILIDAKVGWKITGAGRRATTINTAMLGSAFRLGTVIGSPIGLFSMQHLSLTSTNAANKGSGILAAAVGAADISDVEITGFRFSLTEINAEVFRCDGVVFNFPTQACVWIVNSGDYNPTYAEAGIDYSSYTGGDANAISFYGCQFNGASSPAPILVIDDGGYNHAWYSCNFNSGTSAFRFAGVSMAIVVSADFEGQTNDIVLSSTGTYHSAAGVGPNLEVTFQASMLTPFPGKACFDGSVFESLILLGNRFNTAFAVVKNANGSNILSFRSLLNNGPLYDVTPSSYFDLAGDNTAKAITTSMPISTTSTLSGVMAPTTVAFAALGTPPNGTIKFCSDCNATCTAGASTGRTCFRENGAWTH